MLNDWKECRWGEIATLEYGKGLRGYEDAAGPFPVYGTNGQIGWHSEPLCSHAGVIIGRKGAYRGVHYSKKPFFAIDTAFYVEPNVKMDMRWAYYELLTHDINSMDSGSAIPSTSRGSFYNLRVLLPPIREQEAVAHILGTLDDKIELNRRMNETLEAMARATFKSWFVDFLPVRAKIAARAQTGDPVRAKLALSKAEGAEGRQPFGMDAETAALFPNSFQDSPLGKVPRGWRVRDLGEICEAIDCLHSKKPNRSDRGKPLLQLWNIRDDGLLDMNDTYWISEEDYHLWTSRIEARPGDCVITNVGRVGAVSQIPFGTFAALGRNMTAVRTKSNYGFPTFLIECLLSSAMRQEIESKVDSGTILDSLNVRNIPKLRLVLPSIPVVERFEKLCRPLRHRMERNQAESCTLAAIRDTLLPKLISGEIRVKDAERFLQSQQD